METQYNARITRIPPTVMGRKRGYRGQDETYAFYDVYWMKVSDHYLIQEESRFKQHNRKLGVKPIFGPLPREILEGDVPEDSVDQHCLTILRKTFKHRGVDDELQDLAL